MPERVAVFLDRDGTLIEDRDYLRDADGVVLLPGAAEAVRQLNARSTLAIVVTNQSGIGRGLLTEAEYQATAIRLQELLLADGARVDAQYHCPHAPDHMPPCDCRKPGTGLYERAARDLGIDLAQSLYVGDRWRDVAPGLTLGGLAVLVPSPSTPPDDRERAQLEATVALTLAAAINMWLPA